MKSSLILVAALYVLHAVDIAHAANPVEFETNKIDDAMRRASAKTKVDVSGKFGGGSGGLSMLPQGGEDAGRSRKPTYRYSTHYVSTLCVSTGDLGKFGGLIQEFFKEMKTVLQDAGRITDEAEPVHMADGRWVWETSSMEFRTSSGQGILQVNATPIANEKIWVSLTYFESTEFKVQQASASDSDKPAN